MAFDWKEAQRFAVEIAHESGIVADIWTVQPRGGAPNDPRHYYLVLRDGNDTEIADIEDWENYKRRHLNPQSP